MAYRALCHTWRQNCYVARPRLKSALVYWLWSVMMSVYLHLTENGFNLRMGFRLENSVTYYV